VKVSYNEMRCCRKLSEFCLDSVVSVSVRSDKLGENRKIKEGEQQVCLLLYGK